MKSRILQYTYNVVKTEEMTTKSKKTLKFQQMYKFSRKNYITVIENTTGKLIQKSNSPFTNCSNVVVKDECNSEV